MWAFTGSAGDSGKRSGGRRSTPRRAQTVGAARVYKKSAFSRAQGQETCSKFFHRPTGEPGGSADKRMIHARGPVGPRQPPPPGSIPAGRQG
jgi:hypothetical protein